MNMHPIEIHMEAGERAQTERHSGVITPELVYNLRQHSGKKAARYIETSMWHPLQKTVVDFIEMIPGAEDTVCQFACSHCRFAAHAIKSRIVDKTTDTIALEYSCDKKPRQTGFIYITENDALAVSKDASMPEECDVLKEWESKTISAAYNIAVVDGYAESYEFETKCNETWDDKMDRQREIKRSIADRRIYKNRKIAEVFGKYNHDIDKYIAENFITKGWKGFEQYFAGYSSFLDGIQPKYNRRVAAELLERFKETQDTDFFKEYLGVIGVSEVIEAARQVIDGYNNIYRRFLNHHQ